MFNNIVTYHNFHVIGSFHGTDIFIKEQLRKMEFHNLKGYDCQVIIYTFKTS